MPATPEFGPNFGIGHNSQTAPDMAWRSYAWRQAKRQARRQPSAQMVRYHMARAGELGMGYATYAALHRIAGRDPAGLIFTPDGLGLRLKRRLELPDSLRRYLAPLRGCALLALAPCGEDSAAFLEELRDETALPFAAAGQMPADDAPWQAKAQAVRAALTPQRLPGAAVVLIGTKPQDLAMMTAAGLAGFIDHASFFGLSSAA